MHALEYHKIIKGHAISNMEVKGHFKYGSERSAYVQNNSDTNTLLHVSDKPWDVQWGCQWLFQNGIMWAVLELLVIAEIIYVNVPASRLCCFPEWRLCTTTYESSLELSVQVSWNDMSRDHTGLLNFHYTLTRYVENPTRTTQCRRNQTRSGLSCTCVCLLWIIVLVYKDLSWSCYRVMRS